MFQFRIKLIRVNPCNKTWKSEVRLVFPSGYQYDTLQKLIMTLTLTTTLGERDTMLIRNDELFLVSQVQHLI